MSPQKGRVSVATLLWSCCAATVLCVSSCSRQGEGKALASGRHSSGSYTAGEQVARLKRNPLIPSKSLTLYLPAQSTMLYLSVPDVAAAVSAIRNSPLRQLWESPLLTAAVQRYLGARVWEIGALMVRRCAEGVWRGPLEAAMTASAQGFQKVDVQLYLWWHARAGGEQFVRSFTDCLVALKQKVPDLTLQEQQVSHGIVLRSVALQKEPQARLFYASVGGEVRISTEQAFVTAPQKASKDLYHDRRFATVANRVRVKGTPLGFFYVALKHSFQLVQPHVPIPPTVWEKTGLASMEAAGLSSYQRGGSVREKLFLKWPEKKRGIMGAFFRPANVRGATTCVPADVSSFGVSGIDLPGAWKGVKELLTEVFPQAALSLQAVSTQWAAVAGFDLEKLLGAFGTDWISYSFQRHGMPVSVMVVALRNSEKVRLSFARLQKKAGRRLLVESVDAVPIFTAPLGAPFFLAVCEHFMVLSADIEAVRDFVRNRKGRSRPLAALPAMKEILRLENVAGLSYMKFNQHLSAVSQAAAVSSMSKLPGSLPVPPEVLTGALSRILSVDMGEVWILTFLDPEGVTCEARSNYGLIPFATSAGAVVASVGIPAALKASEAKQREQVVQALRTIAAGQETFRTRYGRYAQNLWELRNAMLIGAELGRGYKHNYLFKVRSSSSDTWHVEARPLQERGRYFYCDQTGIVRWEQGKQARSDSPVATGIGK